MGPSITRAMRSFVTWASASRLRLILLAIVCAQFLAPVSAALLVVDALRRGPTAVLQSALLAILGVLLIGVVLGADLSDTLSLTAPILIGGALSGALLNWSRSLSLAFQGTIIGALVAAFLVFTVVPEAGRIGEMLQAEVLKLLEMGQATEAQLAQAAAVDPIEFVWVLLISLLIVLLGALMLGYWWYALIDKRVRFGSDFRALKLGRVTGIAMMVLLILALFLDAGLIQYLAPVAVIGFLFQGLAVLHSRSHSDKWPKAIIVVVYFLFVPWTYMALMGLSAVGLLDNFFELRARRKPDE